MEKSLKLAKNLSRANNRLAIFIRKLLLGAIKMYQKTISPDHGIISFRFPSGVCRFSPTCSEYAYQAVESHGILKGILLSVKRILRCNPFTRGGYDPVPRNISLSQDNKITK